MANYDDKTYSGYTTPTPEPIDWSSVNTIPPLTDINTNPSSPAICTESSEIGCNQNHSREFFSLNDNVQ